MCTDPEINVLLFVARVLPRKQNKPQSRMVTRRKWFSTWLDTAWCFLLKDTVEIVQKWRTWTRNVYLSTEAIYCTYLQVCWHGQFAVTVLCESCLAYFVWQLFPETQTKSHHLAQAQGGLFPSATVVNRKGLSTGRQMERWWDMAIKRSSGASVIHEMM